jgi:hypothetical protein
MEAPTLITTYKRQLPQRNTTLSLNQMKLLSVSEWVYETDMDDLISMFDDLGYKINYKIIIELLLLLDKYDSDCKTFISDRTKFVTINDLYNKCTIQNKNNCYIESIIIQLTNIIKLHNDIKSLNTFPQQNNYILLYRGIDNNSQTLINSLHKLNIGDIYITPTFFSTSVLEKIAVTFVSKQENIENNILWSIRINPEYLKDFPYAYLGDDISNIYNIEKIIDTQNYESEILLNFGAKLKLINKQAIQGMTYQYKTVNIINKNYIVYEFEFIGWDKTVYLDSNHIKDIVLNHLHQIHVKNIQQRKSLHKI